MYFYENHMGGIYYSERNLDYDELYCEQCGDSDWLIGYAKNAEEARELLLTDVEDYDPEYIEEIKELIEEAFSGEDE